MNEIGAIRKLLAAFDAHEAMLAAYRTGSRRTPAKAIDTIIRVKTLLPQIRALAAPTGNPTEDDQ